MAVAETTTTPPQEPQAKSTKTNSLSRKHIMLGIIAGLVLTALCSPLVFIGRSQIRNSSLNPENRSGSGHQIAEAADIPTSTTKVKEEELNSTATLESSGSDQNTSDTRSESQPVVADTPTPEGILVELIQGNAMEFSQPPNWLVYADDQAGTVPTGIQLAPFCKTGCFRYNGWLGLMNPGDSYDVIFKEPTSFIGVQFWGDPGDGIAHVYLDGDLVWEGSTEGTDVNYPGGAFVNYLQLGNLPNIDNHILRIETDAAGGSVVMYFFGSGPVIP
jgi:hypothetical protein